MRADTSALDLQRLPQHVAIIMDGNGRWAQRRGLSRIEGHRRGKDSVRAVVETARQLGIPFLSVFAFSTENWQRPTREVNALMSLLSRYLRTEVKRLMKNEVRVRAIGDLSRLPEAVRRELDQVVELTRDNARLVVGLCVSYGGREDIVQAARRLAERVRAGTLDPGAIDPEAFAGVLSTAGMPDPDLLIRTSGEMRLSNFFLWQLAYTELYVTDTLWPDFREQAFIDALVQYQRRERRFGLTGEQQVRDAPVLRARLATAAVAIPLLLAIIFLAPAWGWGALVVVIALLAVFEFLGLAFPQRLGPRVVGGVLGVLVVLAAVSAPQPGVGLVAALASILPLAMSYVVLCRRDLPVALGDVGLIAIGVLYGGLLLPHFFWLRGLPDGAAWVTFVIAIAMAGDTGGYFVGHAIGRHKLIPHLSPGKTVEGALGIVAASLLCAAAAKLILLPAHGWAEMLGLGLALSLVGQLGDLGESVMKRTFGAKESGALFPGHGGVLDRIDSLLFPVVVVYYYRLVSGDAPPC